MEDWSFLDNIDFGGSDLGALDWANQIPIDNLSWLDNIDFGGSDLGALDWGNQVPSTGTSWGLSQNQLNEIYNTVSGGAPTWTSGGDGSLLGTLNSLLGSPLGQLGISTLLGTLAQNAQTPTGTKPTVSSITNPLIQQLMEATGPQLLVTLQDIFSQLGKVSSTGAMSPESQALLKTAGNLSLVDPTKDILTQSLLKYITTGGQLTPEEIQARQVYETAMGPQLLQKTQDLIRSMGAGAWSSGPMAQLMQEAIAKAQLESATGYSSFLTNQGTNLAARQKAVAGALPGLSQEYTSNLSPIGQAKQTVAAWETPAEQTRAVEKSLREQGQNLLNTIYGKASPTSYVQTATAAEQPYWSKVLAGAASGTATGGLDQTISGLGDAVTSLAQLLGIG